MRCYAFSSIQELITMGTLKRKHTHVNKRTHSLVAYSSRRAPRARLHIVIRSVVIIGICFSLAAVGKK